MAVVANSYTPYRDGLHRRIALEIGEIRLYSLYTHETSNAPWVFAPGAGTNAVLFGRLQSAREQSAPRYALREWRKGGEIVRWLEANRIAAVVMLGYSDLGRLRIIRWCRSRGVPCLLAGDSNILADTARGVRSVIKSMVLRAIVRWCTAFLPFGTLGRDYFLRYGASPERIFYFPYEPSYDLILRLPESAVSAALTRFGLPQERKRIVCSGRLVSRKRPELVLEAFLEIASLRPEWDLIFVGDGPLRADLLSRVPQEMRHRVHFTAFVEDQTVLAGLYRGSDVLVVASELEPWGLVVGEGAAAGLALICSHVVGAAAELVRDGLNGAIFVSGDAKDLARRLLDVTDRLHLDGMKRASRQVLDDWRMRSDPIDGLRHALRLAGVL